MRFRIAGGLVALECLRDDPVVEFRLHRDWGDSERVGEVINEMLGLGVFPLLGMDGERLLAKRVGIALAETREFHFGQRVQAGTRHRHLRERHRANETH